MEFRQIPEAPDYEINSSGEVCNRITGRVFRGHRMTTGYRTVDLVVHGRKKKFLLHRILANLFIPNPNNLHEVNHKDRDRDNNSLENLEWVSPSQNIRHAFETGVGDRSAIVDYALVPALLDSYLQGTPFIDLLPQTRTEDAGSLRKLLRREAIRQGRLSEFLTAAASVKQTLIQRQSQKVKATGESGSLEFDSINDAARYFDKNPGSVWKALKMGKRLADHKWSYV